MKCSVCAQDIPEDRYSDHLESEHGVTDDPTAVLIQHLSGLASTVGGGEDEGEEGLPDEEPSDADAFEQFLAAHPAQDESSDVEAEQSDEPAGVEEHDEEPEEQHEEPEEEAEPPAAETEPQAEPEEALEDEQPEAEDEEPEAEDELTDEDEAEFERMLAAAPAVDLAKGEATEAMGAEPATLTTEPAARDEVTFAVWDEARGAGPASGEDVVVVGPDPEVEAARRRRLAAFVGLAAVIILIAIAVVYLLTRSPTTKKTTATAPITTPLTTVAPTFLPGPAGGATTTVAAPNPTQAPGTTAVPAAPATPATTATADPGTKIVFSYSGAECTQSGGLTVFGTITNTNPGTYTFSYTIVLLRSDGSQQGTASGAVSHLPPGGRFGPGAIGSGTCAYPLASGPNPRQTITSITPG